MERSSEPLDALSWRDRDALRALLVAAVAAAGRTDVRNDALPSLISSAPVDMLPAAAEVHRVSGIVLRGLDGVDGVPDEVRQALDSRRGQTALHHLLVVGALSDVGRALDAADVAWVAMKGPIVAGILYPDAGDRSYADLDLLVVRRDFPRAMAILEEFGYRPAIKNWALAEEMLAGQLTMSGPAVHIDLHWELHYSSDDRRPFGFVPEEMVARSRSVDAAGLRAPTFDAPDTLITLAFHAARSGGHRLLWLKDIERSLAIDRPDLDAVVRRSRAYRCGPAVGVVLDRARSILGADVPDEILRALTPAPLRVANRLAARVAPPVQLHERDTVTRWLTRSMRSSVASSVLETPQRAVRRLMWRLFPPEVNESDDPVEKTSYLDAVSGSRPRPTRS